MSKLVLISHGQLCEELKKSAEMIMGPQDDIATVALLPNEGPEDFQAKFKAAIEGEDDVTVLADLKGGTPNNVAARDVLPVAGVFIYVGIMPMTEPFQDLGILDDHGWIPTDEHMRTKVPGIFAIGDVRAKDLRQITTAVGEGGTAGQGVFNYIQSLNDTSVEVKA